jgi:hypothetical protein
MSGASSLPQLPRIEDPNLLLEVYTHKDLRQPTSPNEPCEWGDIERLADLGSQALSIAITTHLFTKRPIVRAEEIRVNFCPV